MGVSNNLKTLVAASAFALAQNASAGLIEFDTCVTNCDVLDTQFNEQITSLASLTFGDNGAGGVDFVLTNSVGDYDADQDRAFLSELFLELTMEPTSSSNASLNVEEILIDTDRFTIEGNFFDVKVDLANTGEGFFNRVLDGDSASWTLNGLSELDVASNSIVLLQRFRTDEGFGASRVLGTYVPGAAQSVPEPGTLALLAFCVAGLARRRSAKRVTQSNDAAA